ncbi:MAG: Clp protease N-terminal domain-containing protein, partial [Jatrophihabitantaceae bacterium]
MFERLDAPARSVIDAAFRAAEDLGDSAIGVEHLLLALTTDASTAALLDAAGADSAELRRVLRARRPRSNPGRDHAALLATFGID